jgi:hypothetical protein
LVDFSKPATEQQLVEFDFGNYLTSNLSSRGHAKGLKTYTCSCGAHTFAAAWSNETENWVRHQRMHPTLRAHAEAIMPAPEKRAPAPLILCSPEDRPLLELRRWRVHKPGHGCRVPWYVQAGPRGMPLQRMILAGAKVVRFLNGCGLDCRRENLLAMTKQQLAEEWRAKKAAAQKEREAAKAAA